MAQYERETLVARLMAAKARKAAEGGYAGGRPPFGYRAHQGALVPSEPEASVVRCIFERVAQDEWTIRRVATALDEEGTLGRRWRTSDVHRILTREDYKLGPPGAKVIDPRVWNRAASVLAARRKR